MSPPVWLAQPSRFAGTKRRSARLVLAGLALLILASLSAIAAPGPAAVSQNPASTVSSQTDLLLYESIIAGVRGGGDYYSVAAQAQRSGGYPVRPFVTMRLPTLAVVLAALPRTLAILMLYLLCMAVLAAWYVRLGGIFARPPPRVIALALVGCGGMIFLRADLLAFHEIWAGLLVALSLAMWRDDRWVEAVAIGACAMLIRETAALYAIVMALCALAGGHRREAMGWAVALALLGVAVTAHYVAWSAIILPNDPVGPGWSGLLGFGFFVKALTLTTALTVLPEWLAAPIIGFSLFGWLAWRDPAATRLLAVLSAYALLISLFCRTDTSYWVLLVAPVSLVGLAFIPDALRDLYVAALDSRRITVTRSVR